MVSAKMGSALPGAIAVSHAQQAVSAKPASISRWPGWRTPILRRQTISDTNPAAAMAWLQKFVSVNSADMSKVSDKFTNKH